MKESTNGTGCSFSAKKSHTLPVELLKCGTIAKYENLTSTAVFGLAHRNFGQVSRKEWLRRHVSGEISIELVLGAQENSAAPL